ncbi:uncharacterized protein LOC125811259 [Solanum verrucosum]|uniref:uncharacterized protein LOC125811259 n=1 Tax=Solanum verrucosum TaxID=315347 RepID=UPI0020D0A7B8|nr:uncharacterized protein LOC125811259 [Solanum verrucosum]
MNYDSFKRKWWKREPKEEAQYSSDVVRESIKLSPTEQEFYMNPRNNHLDVYTKRTTLKVFTFVVNLKSYSGEKKIFQCSGTIIESVDSYKLVFVNLLIIGDPLYVIVHLFDERSFDGQIESYDLHYNVVAIKIQSNTPLSIASLAHLSDSIMIDPSQLRSTEEKSFQFRPHSKSFDHIFGDIVIALGRFYAKPYDITTAPGEFCIDRCDDDLECKEPFKATCKIMRSEEQRERGEGEEKRKAEVLPPLVPVGCWFCGVDGFAWLLGAVATAVMHLARRCCRWSEHCSDCCCPEKKKRRGEGEEEREEEKADRRGGEGEEERRSASGSRRRLAIVGGVEGKGG